jgi:HD superfamily phosphohydrolase
MNLKSKCINDRIHGYIYIPGIIAKFIDTPAFQRLRNLRQLGATPHVFPSATHSRFEHSVGVSYVAGKWARHLRRTQPELGITEDDIMVVQLAGLCHDLGHGVMSHTFELYMKSVNKEYEHERMSVRVFNSMVDEVNNQGINLSISDIEFVGECILGTKLEGGIKNRKGRPENKWFLYDMVNNVHSGFDCDKFDYFERDSSNTNVKLSWALERIIQESRVCTSNNRLCWPEGCLVDILSAFQTRYHLYSKVYEHKTVKAIELMILDAMYLADKSMVFNIYNKNGEKVSLADSVNSVYTFIQTNDCLIDDIRRTQEKSQNATDARNILIRLDTRNLYHVIKNIDEEDPNDIIVQRLCYHWGSGKDNPLNSMYFFKKAPVSAKILDEMEYQHLLPIKFIHEGVRYFKK